MKEHSNADKTYTEDAIIKLQLNFTVNMFEVFELLFQSRSPVLP